MVVSSGSPCLTIAAPGSGKRNSILIISLRKTQSDEELDSTLSERMWCAPNRVRVTRRAGASPCSGKQTVKAAGLWDLRQVAPPPPSLDTWPALLPAPALIPEAEQPLPAEWAGGVGKLAAPGWPPLQPWPEVPEPHGRRGGLILQPQEAPSLLGKAPPLTPRHRAWALGHSPTRYNSPTPASSPSQV